MNEHLLKSIKSQYVKIGKNLETLFEIIEENYVSSTNLSQLESLERELDCINDLIDGITSEIKGDKSYWS